MTCRTRAARLVAWGPRALLQLVGTGLIVLGLRVVSIPDALILTRLTQEQIDAERNSPTMAGIVKEHPRAFAWGVRLLLAGLALAVVVALR